MNWPKVEKKVNTSKFKTKTKNAQSQFSSSGCNHSARLRCTGALEIKGFCFSVLNFNNSKL